MWDGIDDILSKEDEQKQKLTNMFFGIVTIQDSNTKRPPGEGETSYVLQSLEKRFKPQKKILSSIISETEVANREIKKEIRDLNNSAGYKNIHEAKSMYRGAFNQNLSLRLNAVKEMNAIEKTILSEERARCEIKGNSIGMTGMGDVSSEMNKQMALEMKNAGSSQAIDMRTYYNPNNNTNNTNKDVVVPIIKSIPAQSDNTIPNGYIIGENDADLGDSVATVGTDFNKSFESLANRNIVYNKTEGARTNIIPVLRYDAKRDIAWYDEIAEDGRPIKPREVHVGVYKTAKIDRQNMSAQDNLGQTYKLILDEAENMPNTYKEQYNEFGINVDEIIEEKK